ncbi:hypothetical protein BSL78_05158 [Apostichopus japonicus]|uniref:Uncharacterized protein n=1 Tax=Stichopus japonicus TaxID=307972 RepID=A0A2G8LCB9_STIJA|nr:hypothetical protein BSL78_05158 [Apostichopus japonicus]
MHVHSTVHCCSTVHIELNDNGFDESIFSSLTEQDCSKMFPGKVGWAKKVILVARTFGEPTSLLTSEQSSIRPVPTTPMPAMSAPTTSSTTHPAPTSLRVTRQKMLKMLRQLRRWTNPLFA